ncbi:MAG: InlB B-repeat-containing protein [Clostridia bacterium]|nr:InlB B-repeat-containing protein [Clostridia bacterium]
MKKFIKLFLLCLIIFATGFVGIELHNSYSKQINFCHDVNASATPPSKYDLRDYIDIGVESQGNMGICYAFASLTSLETYLALNYGEYYDFSELHFASSLYLKDNYHSSISEALADGGNFTHFALYTQKDKSLVLEEEMPISLASNTSQIINKYNAIEQNFYPIAKVNDTVTFPQYVGNKSQYSTSELTNFRNDVKNHIMKYGSLTAGIYTNTSIFTFSTTNLRVMNDSLVTDQNTINSNINHLVSVVGWDDNYDANGAWNNKGAYICLNSWGTSFGEDGYFYVSYDDYFIESLLQGVTSASLSTTNYKISSISNNQNQTAMFTHVFSGEPTVYTANIFDTTNYVGQKITYIDSFIHGGTTKFYIKFFSSYENALAGINKTTSVTNSSKVDDFSMYSKYKLSSPLSITNNFMVVVREIQDTTKTYSLGGNSSANLGLEPSYYTGLGVGNFDLDEDLWCPGVTGRTLDFTLPLILHTDKSYVQVSPFTSQTDSVTNGKYIKNNATFKNKQLTLNLTNVNINQTILNLIKVTKLYKNSFYDVTSNFEFSSSDSSSVTITMINPVSSTFGEGNYIVSIPCGGTTIYRVFEVQDVSSYSITYNLNGGKATNPTVYTSKQTSLTLNNPTKDGYEFIGWYTDSALTKIFNPNSLPYTNLTLYAKYDIALPTLNSRSNDVLVTYYQGFETTISVNASHYFASELNPLTYQWYKRTSLTSTFSIINGATSPSLTLNNVAQSGYYSCSITITINDTNISSIPCIKTLQPSAETSISVNINPYTYDMSNVKWNYSEAISYDTKPHTVELVGLPNGVTATYTNNIKTDIGTYIATATLIYDNMNGNAYADGVDNLTWQIRKAKITITINDIIANEALSTDTLNSMLSCEITNEYLPEDVITLQDKIEYLNLQYAFQTTDNNYIQIITATTNSFDIYEINIIYGEYRVAVKTLSHNNITTTSSKGFVQNCVFNVQSYNLDSTDNNLLKEKNLIAVGSYDISYSYLNNEEASITIPVEREKLLNNLQVYMLKDGKLTKLNTNIIDNSLTFTTTEENAIYIIAQEDYSHTSNAQMILLIIIISLCIGLCVYAIISGPKHKQYY